MLNTAEKFRLLSQNPIKVAEQQERKAAEIPKMTMAMTMGAW